MIRQFPREAATWPPWGTAPSAATRTVTNNADDGGPRPARGRRRRGYEPTLVEHGSADGSRFVASAVHEAHVAKSLSVVDSDFSANGPFQGGSLYNAGEATLRGSSFAPLALGSGGLGLAAGILLLGQLSRRPSRKRSVRSR